MTRTTDSRPPEEVVIHLREAEALAVRVCVSPIATLLSAVFEALLEQRRGAPESWYAHVRARAGAHTAALASVYRTPSRTFPEFAAPNPIGARATIEEELGALRATDPRRIRAEIECQFGAEPPPAYRPFLAQPERAVGALADRLAAVWTAALEPSWGVIETILEREVLSLGAALATEGPPSLLARLHPRIDFDGLRLRWSTAAVGREVALTDRRLIVVPMVAGPDALLSTNREHAGAVIAYAAPGCAALWEATDAKAGAGLAKLLGETRSRVMLAVSTPASTTDVALQLGVSKALASHHLKALDDLGLVFGARFGRHVYYRLSTRGRSVRDAFGSSP